MGIRRLMRFVLSVFTLLLFVFLFTQIPTAHSGASEKQEPHPNPPASKSDVKQHPAAATTPKPGAPVTSPSLWVGENKKILALSLADGQPALSIPVQQLEDIAVDNARGVVWAGTKKEIAQYDFSGNVIFRHLLKRTGTTSDPRKKDEDDQSDEDSDADHVHLSLDPSDGSVWIGVGRDLIKLSIGNSDLIRLSGLAHIADVSVDASNGSCWVGHKHAIGKYSRDGAFVLDIPLEEENEEQALAADPSTNTLWVGSKHGLIQFNAQGETILQLNGPPNIRDLRVNTADGSLWLITKKKVFHYSSEGQELLVLPLLPRCKGEEDDDAGESGEEGKARGVSLHPTCSGGGTNSGSSDGEKDDDSGCEGNLVALAVDPGDGTCWVATRKTIFKLSNAGEKLLRLGGFKEIEALDLGQGAAGGPELLLCPGTGSEGIPLPPAKGCPSRLYVNWPLVTVSGQTDTTAQTVTINDIPLPDGVMIYGQGDVTWGMREGTFFWAYVNVPYVDGTYTFTAVAEDGEGRKTKKTVTIVRDTVPPHIIVTSPLPWTVTRDRTVTITGTMDDPTAVLRFGWADPPIPVTNGAFSAQYTFADTEGGQSVALTAKDPAGNIGVGYVSIIRDTIPPAIEVATPAEGAAVNNPNLSVSGTIIDPNPASVTLSVNSGPPQPLALSGAAFTDSVSIKNGANNLLFQATDKAGNSGTLTRTVLLDQDPPTGAITVPAPNANLTGVIAVSVTAADAQSGMGSVSLLVDGVVKATLSQPPYDFTLDTFLISAGQHTLTARIIDKAGNTYDAGIPVTIQGQMNVLITSPAAETVTDRSHTLVQGTVVQNKETDAGVVVNGVLAEMQGNAFAAIIPLQEGRNAVTATATNADGLTAQASIGITATALSEPIRVTINPASGILTAKPDGTMSFDTALSAETGLSNMITNYSWDANGDGWAEQAGPALSQITASFQTPGLYFPTVTVTDMLGDTYTETAIVNVLDRNAIDALLKAKWEGMKAALARGDIEGAVGYFNSESRQRYNEIFTALSAQLTQIVQEMQDIQLIYMIDGIAKYRIRKNEIYNGQAIAITYYIYFALDENGLWKVNKF